jgi:hypothetical protein
MGPMWRVPFSMMPTCMEGLCRPFGAFQHEGDPTLREPLLGFPMPWAGRCLVPSKWCMILGTGCCSKQAHLHFIIHELCSMLSSELTMALFLLVSFSASQSLLDYARMPPSKQGMHQPELPNHLDRAKVQGFCWREKPG